MDMFTSSAGMWSMVGLRRYEAERGGGVGGVTTILQ